MEGYKKLDVNKFIAENYGVKKYVKEMNVVNARTLFASRAHMLRTVQFNFKNKPEYIANSHKCICKEDKVPKYRKG